MPIFPNVPDVPGVPAVLRDPLAPFPIPTLLTSDVLGLPFGNSPAPQWGIFQDGEAVIDAESVVSFEFRQDWSISDYPVEEGGFESYDKVNNPFQSRVQFACGGSESDRSAFLQSIEDIAGTLDLYDIVTPDRTYESANVISYNYRRTSLNGVGLLLVEIMVQEVRVTATAEFSETKDPSGADTQSDGTVQTKDPTENQSALYQLTQ